jgi:hypothetical protein
MIDMDKQQAYHDTVDPCSTSHEDADEPTALTNIQLAHQLTNDTATRGDQHKTLPQRYPTKIRCLLQSFLVIITAVADIINAVTHTYTTHVAYDNYRIRCLALIPDGCNVIASHTPDCNAHVIHHKLVKLFTKSTAAIPDDDNLTGDLISATFGYNIRFWFRKQPFIRHWVTTRHQMDPLIEQVMAQTTTILLSDFHAYIASLKVPVVNFEEQQRFNNDARSDICLHIHNMNMSTCIDDDFEYYYDDHDDAPLPNLQPSVYQINVITPCYHDHPVQSQG